MNLANVVTTSKLSTELTKVSHRVLNVAKDSYLYQEGESADKIYLVVSGMIKLCKITEDGRELSYRICNMDQILGDLTLFTEKCVYLLDAYVLTDAIVLEFNKITIEEHFFLNNNLAYEFTKAIGETYKRTQLRYRDIISQGKRGALIATLIRLANTYGVNKPEGILVNFSITNQELGNFCGISRESTNKVLRNLKEEGILNTVKGKIIIYNLERLMDEIEFDKRYLKYYTIN